MSVQSAAAGQGGLQCQHGFMFDLYGNCFRHNLNIVLQLHAAIQCYCPGLRAQAELTGTRGEAGRVDLIFLSGLVIVRFPLIQSLLFAPV